MPFAHRNLKVPACAFMCVLFPLGVCVHRIELQVNICVRWAICPGSNDIEKNKKQLRVALPVDGAIVDNWYEAK